LKLDPESHDRLGLSVDVLGLLHDAAHLYTTGMEHSPTSATGTAWEALSLINENVLPYCYVKMSSCPW
jgi:hypothetical protein